MNLIDLLKQAVVKHPEKTAITGPVKDTSYSYTQLLMTIELVASQLKSAGVEPGSCIGLHYPSGPGYIVLTYAIWHCGACSVPIAVELVPEEKEKICHEISIDAIISKNDIKSVVEVFKKGDLKTIFENTVFFPIRKLREHPESFSEVNAAFLRFTSGTTADSKGVVLSHETIYDRINAANAVLKIGAKDNVVSLLSMSYHFAVSIVSYLSFGATLVLCRNHLGATIIRTVVENSGTIIYGSPVHFKLMATYEKAEMMPSVRMAISTATSLQKEIADEFYSRFNIPLYQAYGIIEVGLPCINHDNPVSEQGSIGKVLPAYEVKLEDIGYGDDMQAIKFRGKGFVDAYYDPWRTRKEIMPDGWFATGDLGHLNENGYLYISGRSKEMIDVNGMKFFPREVESILESHPAIKEACVFSHRHQRFGEIPHAHVVLDRKIEKRPTEEELINYCEQHLTPFKIPKNIKIVHNLARTASGKLIRQESEII